MATELRLDSRYLKTPVLVDADGKIYFSEWVPINLRTVTSGGGDGTSLFEMTEVDAGRYDKVAWNTLRSQFFWWALMQQNNIEDPISEYDFSGAADQPVYPNYRREGANSNILYPADFPLMSDLKVPEIVSGDRIKVPMSVRVFEAIADAQRGSSSTPE